MSPKVPGIMDKTIRDRYYFIDYLQLHRFGKTKEIWSKNRNMLVKEDEYSTDQAIKARKGYKSYVQRCMKPILDWMYPDFEIIKPRNSFSYEIGRKNHRQVINEATKALTGTTEQKIAYVISRYLTSNSFPEEIRNYRDAVAEGAEFVKFKNNEAGLVVQLSEERSLAYQAVKALTKIRKAQDDLIALTGDKEGLLREVLRSSLKKIQGYPAGSKVFIEDEGVGGVVLRQKDEEENGRETRRTYFVKRTNGREDWYRYDDLILISYPVAGSGSSGVAPVETVVLSPVKIAIEEILERVNQDFAGQSNGLSPVVIFNLARAAYVRERIKTGSMDIDFAKLVRNYQVTNADLARINTEGMRLPPPGLSYIDPEDEIFDEDTSVPEEVLNAPMPEPLRQILREMGTIGMPPQVRG